MATNGPAAQADRHLDMQPYMQGGGARATSETDTRAHTSALIALPLVVDVVNHVYMVAKQNVPGGMLEKWHEDWLVTMTLRDAHHFERHH